MEKTYAFISAIGMPSSAAVNPLKWRQFVMLLYSFNSFRPHKQSAWCKVDEITIVHCNKGFRLVIITIWYFSKPDLAYSVIIV